MKYCKMWSCLLLPLIYFLLGLLIEIMKLLKWKRKHLQIFKQHKSSCLKLYSKNNPLTIQVRLNLMRFSTSFLKDKRCIRAGGRSSFIFRSSDMAACSCSITTSSPNWKEEEMFSCRNSRSSSKGIFNRRSEKVQEGHFTTYSQHACASNMT